MKSNSPKTFISFSSAGDLYSSGRLEIESARLRQDLFDNMPAEQVWDDYVTWLDRWVQVGQNGDFIELEQIDDAAYLVATLYKPGMDLRMSEWYFSKPTDLKLMCISAALDGYGKGRAILAEALVQAIMLRTEMCFRRGNFEAYAVSIATLCLINSNNRMDASTDVAKQLQFFLDQQRENFSTLNLQHKFAPCLEGL